MRCPNCGHLAALGANFCERCGTALPHPGVGGEPAALAPAGAFGGQPALGTSATPAIPTTPESRYWAIGAHVSALVGGFLGGVPAFVGPLVVWLVRKNGDPYAAGHGRNALNFNLSMLLYTAALIVLTVFTFGLGAVVAVPLGTLLGVGWLVFSVLGALRAGNGETFRYPLTIRFLR